MRVQPYQSEWHVSRAVSSHSRFKDQENVASQNIRSSPRAVKGMVSKQSNVQNHLIAMSYLAMYKH